jgi:uncharacterized protein (TIGR02147 family)
MTRCHIFIINYYQYLLCFINMAELYNFTEYKAFIRAMLEENKARGYQGKLAEGAGCQRSFLSQALNGPVEITPDHAAGMAKFWNLNDEESEYFLLLVSHSRAATAPLKRMIENRLESLRKMKEHIGERLKQPKLASSEDASIYYSSWQIAALHLLSGTKDYRTVEKMAKRLSLPEALVKELLQKLEGLGLVEKQASNWKNTKRSIHSPADSPYSWNHHSNWRQRALLDAQSPSEKSLHYTALHTLSQEDMGRLRELIRQFIEETRKIIGPSQSEELACLNIDLFVV